MKRNIIALILGVMLVFAGCNTTPSGDSTSNASSDSSITSDASSVNGSSDSPSPTDEEHVDENNDEKCDECGESRATDPDTPGTDTPGTDTPGTDTPGTDTPDDPENTGTSDPSVIFALATLVSAGGFTLFAAKKSKKD